MNHAGYRRPILDFRVGLVRFFSRVACLNITVPPGARLIDAAGSVRAKGPGEWQFRARKGQVMAADATGRALASGASLRVEPPGETSPLALSIPPSPGSVPKAAAQPLYRYRGAVEVTAVTEPGNAGPARRGDDREPNHPITQPPDHPFLRIVNILPLETYLRGVIPAEMPPSAPPDALRAQAILARTYALKCRGRYQAEGYDLRDTLDSQVYGGVEVERGTTDAAVRETAGLVLTRGGQLIRANYYADCGGVTAPGEREDDFPPSVVDAPKEGGPAYCARGTYHVWTLTVGVEEIAMRLDASIREALGPLREIAVLETDTTGRARRVQIVGEQGVHEMTGSAFRLLLGSTRLRSTLFTVERDITGAFVFQGRGYGHGRGLCQWGAMGMAAEPHGRSFRDILAHYYPGAKIVEYWSVGVLEHRPRDSNTPVLQYSTPSGGRDGGR